MTKPNNNSSIIHKIHTVLNAENGMRLDVLAKQLLPDYSRSVLQKWIQQGDLTIDGQIRKCQYKVVVGEKLRLYTRLKASVAVAPQNIALPIVFQNDDVLVIDKPVGLVVHPGAGNADATMQNALLYLDSQLANVPRAGIVHRLDKDTSGLLVIARNLKCHTQLVAAMQNRSIQRYYLAITASKNLKQRDTINAPIGRHRTQRTKMAVTASGKQAITHYQIIDSNQQYQLLLVKLDSGRTHQIRVHLKERAAPIIGDQVYAPKNIAALAPRQMLHAWQLSLPKIADNSAVVIKSELPQDFLNTMQQYQLQMPTNLSIHF